MTGPLDWAPPGADREMGHPRRHWKFYSRTPATRASIWPATWPAVSRDNSDNKYLTWQNSLASIAGGTANVFRPYTFANPYDRRTPRSLQYMLNVQRELAGNALF